MNKTAYILFSAVVFGLCVFFSAGLLFQGAADPDRTALPEFMKENHINDDFGSEFEEWFSKNFAFSDTITDIYTDIKLALFNEGNSQVIVGKDNFLFFADTINDYVGLDRMSDEDIRRTAQVLALLNDQSAEAGAEFLFVCAPNKNSVYGEYMPARYKKSGSLSDLDRLYRELDLLGVHYIDLRDVLRQSDRLTYHKRDTHWNGIGAQIAFGMITAHFGVNMPDYGEEVVVTDFEGDLDALLYPGKTKYDVNTTRNFDGMFIFTSAYSNPMDLGITSRSGATGKLLMFRDSFANALIPYAASSFGEVRMERIIPYNMAQLETYAPDYVIVEIAERNIRNIANYITVNEE